MIFKKNKKGFTLIELLAVIVVLAIILIITVSPIIANIHKAKERSFHTVGESIKKYLKSNYDNCKLSKNNLSLEYDYEIFDDNCSLKEENNLSEILIKNAGYKPEDLKEIEIWSDDDGNFELTISAKEKGKFDGVNDYVSGPYCWFIKPVEDGNYKLTKFYGIKHDGTIKDECNDYVKLDDDGFYEVTIPNKVNEKNITVIGNKLFNSVEEFNILNKDSELGVEIIKDVDIISNNYVKIKKIIISEGITEIEDVVIENDSLPNIMNTPFSGIGVTGVDSSGFTLENFEIKFDTHFDLKVSFPNTLKKIGKAAFFATSIESIKIPSSVIDIGEYSFGYNLNLKKVEFSDGLIKIESNAFMFNPLEELVLPETIKEIGKIAFYKTNISSLKIPSSVETIGESSFANNKKLKKIIFGENSNLKTIENLAFNYSGLNYDSTSPLILPSSIKVIGKGAFGENPELLSIRFNGTLTAGNTDWYDFSVTTLNP